MSKHPDMFLAPAEAITYIEKKEQEEGLPLAKVEVIEYFFEWLKNEPASVQINILREALKD